MKTDTIKWVVIENIFTIIVTGATTVGLYYMSSSFYSLWALLLMLNISTVTTSKD